MANAQGVRSINPVAQRIRPDPTDRRRLFLDDGRPVLCVIGGGHEHPFTPEDLATISAWICECWNAMSVAPNTLNGRPHWPPDASDRVHDLIGQLAAKELECQRLRETLNFIATHFSTEWPERCQTNVLAARKALEKPQGGRTR